MLDGNILTAIGLDPLLMTAGSCGGLVKALTDRTSFWGCLRLLVVGALTANFFAIPAVDAAASGLLFGFKFQASKGFAAFVVGGVAMIVLPLIGTWVTSKISRSSANG